MRKNKLAMSGRHDLTGWAFLSVASLMIVWMNFYPMIKAFHLAMQTGTGARMRYAGLINFQRILVDPTFKETLGTTFLYLIIQVPIMLIFALILASMLNSPTLKCKGLFRTAIFLPCATSLVSYAVIFRQLFALDGYINVVLVRLGMLEAGYQWLSYTWSARLVIIIALLWRWTGYNMVFYLAGLQNIENSIYEAARIDGANALQQLTKITIPLLKPIILLTAIMSTNGTLQLFDESFNLTNGGPANSTMTMSHYIYRTSFQLSSDLGYSTAMAFVIFVLVAVLALIQMKVGDKR
ncbi:MAG: sugar ABC transporter permease [Oscillospiraceae bacterium]|nr:sugar ABC transporter permease [Oscillospiraceae bacterium]